MSVIEHVNVLRPRTTVDWQRRPNDAAVAAVGIAIIVLTGIIARHGLIAGEGAVFHVVNSWPDVFYIVIWPFMQLGVFLTIPAFIVLAVIAHRFRLATAMAIAGFGVYLLAKVAKEVVERARPIVLLDDVHEREHLVTGSIGFPSGHLAVAA